MQYRNRSFRTGLAVLAAAVGLAWAFPAWSFAATTQGVAGKNVSLGAWAPESGPTTVLFATSEGAAAYFKWVNAHGGIHGYHFNFTMVNDQYNPALTPAAARRLVTVDKVFAIVAGTGTPSSVAVLSYITGVGIPSIAPASGDPSLTQPVRKNIYTVVPSYVNESAFQAQYAVTHLHSKSVAIIYQNDDIGKTGLAGVTKMLALHGMKPATAVPFEPGTLAFIPYVARLKASGAQTVIIWGSIPPFVPILKAAESIGYRPTWITYAFDADPSVVSQVPPAQLANTYFDSWMPLPDDQGMADYRQAIKQYYPQAKIGLLSVQGWCLASVFGSAFADMVARRATPSWSGLEHALNGMKHFSNAYVHDLTFSPTNHQGLPAEFVMKYEHGAIKKVTPYLPLPVVH